MSFPLILEKTSHPFLVIQCLNFDKMLTFKKVLENSHPFLVFQPLNLAKMLKIKKVIEI